MNSSHKIPNLAQPVAVETPKVVEEGSAGPAFVTEVNTAKVGTIPQNQPVVFIAETPAGIHKLFVEPIGNHLDEVLRAEMLKQLAGRITIVTERRDADATLKGLSGARDARNDPSGFHDNATGSLSLYDKSGKVILWSGEADDRKREFFTTEHGGEAKVAQRLVKGLKGYLNPE